MSVQDEKLGGVARYLVRVLSHEIHPLARSSLNAAINLLNEVRGKTHGLSHGDDIDRTVAQGGGLIEMNVQIGGQRWIGGMVIDRAEVDAVLMTQTELVRARAREMIENIDLETPEGM